MYFLLSLFSTFFYSFPFRVSKQNLKEKMSGDLMARKNYKWLGFILILSTLALLSIYYTPTTNYSYYRRAVFYKDDSTTLETANSSVMSWTDGNGKDIHSTGKTRLYLI